MIVVIVMMFCLVFIAVGAYLFLNRPQEGDECEGKDENGNYEIDDKGKCVLDSCTSGYYKSGKECLIDQSGEVCVPEGTPDPQGVYLTDQMGGCELSCETGYVVSGDVCEWGVSGQYVRLIQTVAYDANAMRDDGTTAGNDDDKNKILNLAELEVFAPGGTTSLAAGKTVTGTAIAASYPGANLVDGNMTNFAHTWGRDATVKDEFTVDLGSVQEIEKIKITNRTSCCKNRAIGVKAQIIGSDGTTVVTETPAISTAADTYTFTFPGTAWA